MILCNIRRACCYFTHSRHVPTRTRHIIIIIYNVYKIKHYTAIAAAAVSFVARDTRPGYYAFAIRQYKLSIIILLFYNRLLLYGDARTVYLTGRVAPDYTR